MSCVLKLENCVSCVSESVCGLCFDGYAVLKAQCVKLPTGFKKATFLADIPYGYYEEFGFLQVRPSLTGSDEDKEGGLSSTAGGSFLIILAIVLMMMGVAIIGIGIYFKAKGWKEE